MERRDFIKTTASVIAAGPLTGVLKGPLSGLLKSAPIIAPPVDIYAQYAKLIMPVMRRMAPELIAPAFFGVQPLNGPIAYGDGFVDITDPIRTVFDENAEYLHAMTQQPIWTCSEVLRKFNGDLGNAMSSLIGASI